MLLKYFFNWFFHRYKTVYSFFNKFLCRVSSIPVSCSLASHCLEEVIKGSMAVKKSAGEKKGWCPDPGLESSELLFSQSSDRWKKETACGSFYQWVHWIRRDSLRFYWRSRTTLGENKRGSLIILNASDAFLSSMFLFSSTCFWKIITRKYRWNYSLVVNFLVKYVRTFWPHRLIAIIKLKISHKVEDCV